MDSLCLEDSTVGILSGQCRGGLDFTVAFEDYVLLMVPAASLLLLAPLRFRTIWSRTIKVVTPTILQALKTLSALCFTGFSLAIVVLSTQIHSNDRKAEVAAAVVSFLASLAAVVLSHLEHMRSIRPSAMLQLYLMIAVVMEAVHLRTVWIRSDDVLFKAFCLCQLLSSAAFLAAESVEKESILLGRRPRSPQDANDLFSQRLFWWLNHLFKTGYQKVLAPSDLCHIDEDLASPEASRRFKMEWLAHSNRDPNVSLFRITFHALTGSMLFPIVPRLLLLAVTFAQPFLIERFVVYVDNPKAAGPNEGPLLVLATVLVYCLLATIQSWYWQCVCRFQTKLRGCLITAIHDKALRSRPTPESSPLMLMNVDVEKALAGLRSMHEFWAMSVCIIIALYLLKIQVGLSFLAPMLLLAILTAVIATTGKNIAPQQKRWLVATQKRISFITDVIQAMKNVKLLGLAPTIQDIGTSLREDEVGAQKKLRQLMFLNIMISQVTFQLCTLVTYGAFAVQTSYGAAPLTNTRLFTSLSVLKLFTTPLLSTIQAVPQFLQALAALDRIQTYLLQAEHHDRRGELETPMSIRINRGITDFGQIVAEAKNLSCGYKHGPSVLVDVNCSIQRGQLHVVVGSVGSGKSTFLKTFLGETNISSGTCLLATYDVAFCDQQPWLWNASIKTNIVGEQLLDEPWFRHVTWACGLTEDFDQLAKGADTLAGDNGTALSGGQKNRISLARAVYSRKHFLLIDDVLSGLDKRTESLVFRRVFGPQGLLKHLNCTTVLATHSVGWLPHADIIIPVENHSAKCVEQQHFSRSQSRLQINLPNSSLANETYGPHGGILSDTVPKTLDNGIGVPQPVRNRDSSVYLEYIRSFGLRGLLLYTFMLMASTATTTVQTLFLKWWAAALPTSSARLGLYAGLFTIITAINVMALAVELGYALLILLPVSSLYLHARQWKALMRVSFAAWGSRDTGSVANRFSQDVALIDTTLPNAFMNFAALTFMVIANIALLIVATPFVAVALPVVAGFLYVIQKVYLRTSKQLRVMDLEAKAPLCGHFLETAAGVVTITAFGWTERNRERNEQLLDSSQAPFYLLISVQQWLALVLNLVVAALSTVLMAVCVGLADRIDPGYLGLAMLSIMDLGWLLEILVTAWTSLETSLGAVTRITDFVASTPKEEQGKVLPPSDWLSTGTIELSRVTASYSDAAEPILSDVSLSIEPGKKIAICGRTGSGKSSLASALFGLLHVKEGVIFVDRVDVTQVSQDLLRSKMIALPQDPYFAPGTVRQNLALRQDISMAASDQAMMATLDKVGLGEKFRDLAGRSSIWDTPLDVDLSPADMLTRGQQQLFAMARAMLSKGQIIVIDEATSGLDAESDALFQKLLRHEFAGRTIIAIAHRLNTIIDFDTVILMDHGKIIEQGVPEELARNTDSLFGALFKSRS